MLTTGGKSLYRFAVFYWVHCGGFFGYASKKVWHDTAGQWRRWVLSEQDFDDLVDIDRADLRRHMVLAIVAVFAGLLIMLLPGFLNLPEAASGLIGKATGVGVAAVSSMPMTKMLGLSKSIDRLNSVRRRWRRLKEQGTEAAAGIDQIEQLVWDAYK